ncbi:transposase [Streptomyces sp. NPDC051051]|uniref:transposase n=1 Tax=Streptomyces sp. NPDC051051 TaxID=3155666 RepID=UPI0034352E41
MVGRIDLDVLRSGRTRSQTSYDDVLPELVVTLDDSPPPEDDVVISDSTGLAPFVVLESLRPGERPAFVLHDLVAVPFDEIHQTRERCQAARIPDERAFATEGNLTRGMILRALASPPPIAWVIAGSAYGQDSHLRRLLEDHGLSYPVVVPKWQQVHAPRIDHASPGPRPGHGNVCRRGREPRANGSTTGPPPTCPQWGNSTALSRPGNGGYWPAAASAGPTRSPTTSPAPRWRPLLPTCRRRRRRRAGCRRR